MNYITRGRILLGFMLIMLIGFVLVVNGMVTFLSLVQHNANPVDAFKSFGWPFVLTLIGSIGFLIVGILDIVQNKNNTSNTKAVWVLILLLTGLLGGIVYLFMRRDMWRNSEDVVIGNS
jgi:uncharacterized membrane protein HdeD (DUF308 family)